MIDVEYPRLRNLQRLSQRHEIDVLLAMLLSVRHLHRVVIRRELGCTVLPKQYLSYQDIQIVSDWFFFFLIFQFSKYIKNLDRIAISVHSENRAQN